MDSVVEARRTSWSTGQIVGAVWLVVTLALLAHGFREAIFLSPPDAAQGNVGRVLYWHVPSAILGLLFPYVNLIASFAYLYLRRRDPLAALTADAWAIAAAEVSVVLATVCLATGMLWGRAVWGIWWTWDWRLTSELLLWLLYVAYLMVRRMAVDGQTSTLAAVISIFAAIDVPIVYFSIRWFRTQHPSPIFGGDEGSGLDKSMYPAFLWNVLAWFMWSLFMLGFRIALEKRRQHLQQMATLRAIEGDLTNFDYRRQEPGNAF